MFKMLLTVSSLTLLSDSLSSIFHEYKHLLQGRSEFQSSQLLILVELWFTLVLAGSLLATKCLIIGFRHNVYNAMIARCLRPAQFFFSS